MSTCTKPLAWARFGCTKPPKCCRRCLHPKRLPKPRRRPFKSSLHRPFGTTRRLSATHTPNPNHSPNPPHNQRPNLPNAAIFHGPNRLALRACWY